MPAELTDANRKRLWTTYDHIVGHPEEWDQSKWHCGTAMCFAGRAASMFGGMWSSMFSNYLLAWPSEPEFGGLVHVQERARRILGLTELEAMVLFHAENTLSDIHRILTKIVNGELR